METLALNDAAAFLHMSPVVLRNKARLGIVKAAKPGKCWVFLKSDLVDYLDSLYAGRRQALASDCESGDSLCHYKSEATRGGLTSSQQTANGYAALLGLRTKG